MASGTESQPFESVLSNYLSKEIVYIRDANLNDTLHGTGLVWTSSTPGLSTAVGGDMVYFIQLFYNGVSLTSPRIQIVFPYDYKQTKIGWRTYSGVSNSWSEWKVIQGS